MLDQNGTDICLFYLKVLTEYENIINGYYFQIYDLKDHEKVYVIQDSFIIYIGIINYGNDLFPNNIIVFEELSYNDIFKFNFSKFYRSFGKEGKGLLNYKKFHGVWGEPIRSIGYSYYSNTYIEDLENPYYIRSKCYDVVEYLPILHLHERFEQWEGVLNFFIVYELSDGGRTGYAIYNSKNPQIHKVANKIANEIELYALGCYKNVVISITTVKCDNTMVELLIDRIKKYDATGWEHKLKKNVSFERQCIAEHEMKYYILERYAKTEGEAYRICEEIFNGVHNGLYQNEPRYEYIIPENKWKSEQMVYEIVKRLYKDYPVLYQHRPYFLHTNKGQMSFDIYICGLDVAIEYQGKQHFEPVAIFGGEQHFNEQVYRDKLKKKLSEKYGVKLVYINYNEDISPKLIKSRIEEALK